MDGGERAVMFDRFRGVLPDVEGEGTHLKVPWVQTPHIMDIRTRPRTISSVTGTKGAWPWVCCGHAQVARPSLLGVVKRQFSSSGVWGNGV